MSKRIVEVSIIGVGARGGEAYGRYLNESKDRFRIVSLCDTDPVRLKKYGELFHVEESNRFLDEEAFWEKKRSELLLICTMDKLHVRMAKRALSLGYNILLEKPISDDPKELQGLYEAYKANGKIVMVCHVLRYTTMIEKIKEILDSKSIGELITIDQTENVAYWHDAHSYVRGNWRKKEDCTSMIMAKCCHDLDLLQYFAKSRCKSLSSMGDLRYFKKENAPEGSSERCTKCQFIDTCPYSAKRIYIDTWEAKGRPADVWPQHAITDADPLTYEAIYKAIDEGRYGRCVYRCDNDVVDNETTIMTFENGVTATLKMEAFTARGGRDIRLLGSLGEIDLHEDEGNGYIELREFGKEVQRWNLKDMAYDNGGHGGGDYAMLDKLYLCLAEGKQDADTSLEKSLESHYMAVAAEKSRLSGGKLIELKDYRG